MQDVSDPILIASVLNLALHSLRKLTKQLGCKNCFLSWISDNKSSEIITAIYSIVNRNMLHK